MTEVYLFQYRTTLDDFVEKERPLSCWTTVGAYMELLDILPDIPSKLRPDSRAQSIRKFTNERSGFGGCTVSDAL